MKRKGFLQVQRQWTQVSTFSCSVLGSNVSVTYQPWKFSNKYQGNLGPRLDCTFNDGTYMLFLLSLSASVLSDFNSTRKQNYMMNFSRQHGLRHFYNRRRRSLRRNPWRIKSLFSFQHVMCCFSFFSISHRIWYQEIPVKDLVINWKPFSRPSVHHFPTLWTNDKWLIFS